MKNLLCFAIIVTVILSFAACDSDVPGILDFGKEKKWVFQEYNPYGDEFVSLWPDKLPDGERPYTFFRTKLDDPDITDFRSFFLYDFPDPNQYFSYQRSDTFIREKGVLYLGFSNDFDVTNEQFDGYVSWLQKAGYTNDELIPDSDSYHCEKYGVSIDLELTYEFPWSGEDERIFVPKNGKVNVYIRIELIDPDYQFDLEAIKAEEYERYLEEFKK